MPDKPIASLDEMRRVLGSLPGPDLEMGSACLAREARLTKPQGALGRLEGLTHWMSMWQGKHPPTTRRPRVAVFAGNHGVTRHGVSAFPTTVTKQMVENFVAGGAAVNQLCTVMDADLRVYELGLDQPTDDFTRGPAMSDEECARAVAYGMMAVEPGVDVLAVGEMGIGNTTSAAALCLGMFGGEARDWVGPGTGVIGERLATKTKVVADAVALHRAECKDGLDWLRRVGGLELAAIVGAVIAARLARIPVLLDGYACTAAAATLFPSDRHALDHCEAAHVSAEPGHRRLLERLNKQPILDLGMRLGEASGAALAIGVLKAAVSCHGGMATFADAKVDGAI